MQSCTNAPFFVEMCMAYVEIGSCTLSHKLFQLLHQKKHFFKYTGIHGHHTGIVLQLSNAW